MNNKIPIIKLQSVEGVEDLRQSVEKAFTNIALTHNRPMDVNDAKSLRIVNVANPNEPTDAVNLQYLKKYTDSIKTAVSTLTRRQRIESEDIEGFLIVLEGYGVDNPQLIGQYSAGGVGTASALSVNDEMLYLSGRGDDGGGISTQDDVSIIFASTETWTNTKHGSMMVFNITPTGTNTMIEGMRLTGAGLGVGTPTPYTDAHVSGDSHSTDPIFVVSVDPGTNTSRMFQVGAYDSGFLSSSYSWIQSYTPGAGAMMLAINPQGGNVGVNDTSPTAQLDVDGVIRATGFSAPADGVGVEIYYKGGVGYILCCSRSPSTYVPMAVNASVLYLNHPVTAGHVLIKTKTDNASGGVLQVKGDITPSVDQGGDLGTTGVQWDDIRWKGNLIQNSTTRISSSGKGSFATGAITGLSSYANNTAAVGGGLSAGDLYIQTGTDPARVCVVV